MDGSRCYMAVAIDINPSPEKSYDASNKENKAYLHMRHYSLIDPIPIPTPPPPPPPPPPPLPFPFPSLTTTLPHLPTSPHTSCHFIPPPPFFLTPPRPSQHPIPSLSRRPPPRTASFTSLPHCIC
ncbi:hypothetical protein E2C01_090934 [Portunus trituberculatus]|uniref:Uncharacterized protein n=1 Tax=Portunus trituberculatus TaxID=210409 RepID=A0A5B7JG28_PORTR|nr:hypothetical protein [Portunus trituberculatus]